VHRSLEEGVLATSHRGSFQRDQDMLFLNECSGNQFRNGATLVKRELVPIDTPQLLILLPLTDYTS